MGRKTGARKLSHIRYSVHCLISHLPSTGIRSEVPSYGGAFALFGPVRDAPGSIFFADSGIIERTEGSLPDGSTLPSILIPLQSLQVNGF